MKPAIDFLITNAPMIWFAVGLLGSALESFGEKFQKPKLVAIGQRFKP